MRAGDADERRRAWIAAGIALGADAAARVPCPACGAAPLAIIDVPIPEAGKLDRWMHCPACRACSVLAVRAG